VVEDDPEMLDLVREHLEVDDDAEMRALLLDVLRNEGYDVAEAMDGAQAVLALRAREYEVILKPSAWKS
jgi:CheY-like chemotaxis protein